jgi:hypothetical protein
MLARVRRRGTAVAIALTAAVTGTTLLLTGCGPDDTTKAMQPATSSAPTTPVACAPAAPGCVYPTPAPTVPANPSNSARPTPTPTKSSPTASPAMNGTAHSRLTISNGTRYVLMNGTSVDFGTAVRDLTWSPDGGKAAFIDGDGDLVTANPDGSRRVVLAKHIPGQTWSHPAWENVNFQNHARQDILFTSTAGGVTTLQTVPADAVDGTPFALFDGGFGDGVKDVPQTANTWPNTSRTNNRSVFANTQTGDVYIRDVYIRDQVHMLTAGSEPALSADGDEVVFVRSVGGHDHIFEQQANSKATAEDLTPNATVDYTEPAISPDGATIAVRTPDGIATLPAWGHLPAPQGAGGGSTVPTLISTHPGLPAYR